MPELCNEEGFTSPAQKVKRLASHDGLDDGDHVNSFEKRGKEKAITRRLPGVRNPVTFRSQSYPSAGDLFRGNRNQTVYPRYLGRRNPFDCLDTQVTASRFGRTNELQGRPQTEHPIDVCIHLLYTATSNVHSGK